MAAFTSIALGIGAAAAVGGTIMSYRAQKKSSKLQEQQQNLATRQSRRQAIRQAQIARAQTIASASAQGATGSSAALGGVGSLNSQVGSQLGFSNQMSGLSAGINQANQSANTWGGVAQLGGTLFNYGQSQGATLGGLLPKGRGGFSPSYSGFSG